MGAALISDRRTVVHGHGTERSVQSGGGTFHARLRAVRIFLQTESKKGRGAHPQIPVYHRDGERRESLCRGFEGGSQTRGIALQAVREIGARFGRTIILAEGWGLALLCAGTKKRHSRAGSQKRDFRNPSDVRARYKRCEPRGSRESRPWVRVAVRRCYPSTTKWHLRRGEKSCKESLRYRIQPLRCGELDASAQM